MATNMDADGGVTRDELLQRVAMMESMISEGRRTTARFGWLFVLWGMADLIGMVWQWYQQNNRWIWPVTIGSAMVLQFIGIAMLRRENKTCSPKSMQCRSIEAVWGMMGLTVSLYCAAAMLHNSTWQVAYVSAILMFVGLAHAISALVLRWRAQGAIAAVWWLGGIATFFLSGVALYAIVVGEMFVGLVAFGIYAMLLERRRGGGGAVPQHA